MLVSIVKNAKDYIKGGIPLKIENANAMEGAIGHIMKDHSILNFPLCRKGQGIFEITKEEIQKYTEHTRYAVYDIRFNDEYSYNNLRKYLDSYQYVIIPSMNILGWVGKARLVLYVDEFKYEDFKALAKLLTDAFKDNNIEAEITSFFRSPDHILFPTNKNNIITNSGSTFSLKMVKVFKRPRNHNKFKEELYPVLLGVFKEMGFLPTSKYSGAANKVSFIHEKSNISGYNWFPNSPFNLWHSNQNLKVNAYEEFIKKHNYWDYVERQSIEEKLTPCGTQLEITEERVNLSRLTASNKEFFANWCRTPNNRILCVKSAMGSAKTAVIRKLVNSNKCLVITPRSQLAVEISNKTTSQCYLHVQHNNIDYNKSLVCQFDSLYKFDLSGYEWVILDEFMTLESHIAQCDRSTLTKNMQKLYNVLQGNVILVDAMLTKNCLDLFCNQNRRAHWYENVVTDNTPLMSHATFNSFLKEISNAQGKKISISCTSKNKLLSLQEFVGDIGYSNRIITGDTTNEERANILEDFRNGLFDCLLYSPAISVGVSIECEVEKHFHYDPGGIVSPIQSIQMIKRSRTTKQIDCFLQKRKRVATSSIEEIRNNIRDNGILCEYTPKGDLKLGATGKMFSWMIRHDNIWRLEGRDSFDYLASLNFNVTNNVKVQGADEFEGRVLNKFIANTEKWSADLRQKSLEYFGCNIEVEDYIEPEEVEIFKYYRDLRRCYDDPVNMDFVKLCCYNNNNFNFERDLELFVDALNGKVKKIDLTHLGLELPTIGYKMKENKRFKILHEILLEKEKGKMLQLMHGIQEEPEDTEDLALPE